MKLLRQAYATEQVRIDAGVRIWSQEVQANSATDVYVQLDDGTVEHWKKTAAGTNLTLQ